MANTSTASTRQDLINSLVQRKLYPKKTANKPLTEQLSPLLAQKQQEEAAKKSLTEQFLPLIQKQQPQPNQPQQPITKMKLPTVPLQKILFLRRTLGI